MEVIEIMETFSTLNVLMLIGIGVFLIGVYKSKKINTKLAEQNRKERLADQDEQDSHRLAHG